MNFQNFEKGRYSLVIYNTIGSRIWSNSYDISGDTTLKEDLSFLPRGTYIYTILDEYQNAIVTKRLAIIKS